MPSRLPAKSAWNSSTRSSPVCTWILEVAWHPVRIPIKSNMRKKRMFRTPECFMDCKRNLSIFGKYCKVIKTLKNRRFFCEKFIFILTAFNFVCKLSVEWWFNRILKVKMRSCFCKHSIYCLLFLFYLVFSISFDGP